MTHIGNKISHSEKRDDQCRGDHVLQGKVKFGWKGEFQMLRKQNYSLSKVCALSGLFYSTRITVAAFASLLSRLLCSGPGPFHIFNMCELLPTKLLIKEVGKKIIMSFN